MGKCWSMFREMIHMLYGAFLWRGLRLRLRIDYKKVVLVLVNENRKLDYYALVHLGDYMDRKHADGAVVLFYDDATCSLAQEALAGCGNVEKPMRLYRCAEKTIATVYDYYSFHKFFDNIAFTYASRPKDNLLAKVLEETQINEEDAVCLGLYRLRKVSAHAAPDKRDK